MASYLYFSLLLLGLQNCASVCKDALKIVEMNTQTIRTGRVIVIPNCNCNSKAPEALQPPDGGTHVGNLGRKLTPPGPTDARTLTFRRADSNIGIAVWLVLSVFPFDYSQMLIIRGQR